MDQFAIAHPLGFVINASFDEAATKLVGELTSELSNGYNWYSLPIIKDENANISVLLCFLRAN